MQAAPPGALDTAKNFLDKLLIADFFAVLAILLWLGAGVAAKVTLDSSVRKHNSVHALLSLLAHVFAALGGCWSDGKHGVQGLLAAAKLGNDCSRKCIDRNCVH